MIQSDGQALSINPHPLFHPNRRWLVIVGMTLIVAALISLVIWSLTRPKTKSSTSSLVAIPNTIVTPGFYQDFVGTVISVDGGTVTVEHGVTKNGKMEASRVAVKIDQHTSLRSQPAGQTEAKSAVIAIDRLRAKDRVHVFGADNLADKTTFTATKLIRLEI